MKKNKKIDLKTLAICLISTMLLPTVLCVGCMDVKYSDSELRNLHKGDTIYVMNFDNPMMATIIHNDTIKEIVQINIGNRCEGNELNLWMKECWTYNEVKKGRGGNSW